jgi:hypothetical protein
VTLQDLIVGAIGSLPKYVDAKDADMRFAPTVGL